MNKDSALYQSVRGLYFGLKNLPNNTKFAMNTHSIKKFKDIIFSKNFEINNKSSIFIMLMNVEL